MKKSPLTLIIVLTTFNFKLICFICSVNLVIVIKLTTRRRRYYTLKFLIHRKLDISSRHAFVDFRMSLGPLGTSKFSVAQHLKSDILIDIATFQYVVIYFRFRSICSVPAKKICDVQNQQQFEATIKQKILKQHFKEF